MNKLMEVYGDTEEDAAVYMKRSDYARASYYRNISGQKWGELRNYRICLDASLGVEKCVQQICNLV